jgi:hypothetical protein
MSLKTRASTWWVPGHPVGGRRALVEGPHRRVGALGDARANTSCSRHRARAPPFQRRQVGRGATLGQGEPVVWPDGGQTRWRTTRWWGHRAWDRSSRGRWPPCGATARVCRRVPRDDAGRLRRGPRSHPRWPPGSGDPLVVFRTGSRRGPACRAGAVRAYPTAGFHRPGSLVVGRPVVPRPRHHVGLLWPRRVIVAFDDDGRRRQRRQARCRLSSLRWPSGRCHQRWVRAAWARFCYPPRPHGDHPAHRDQLRARREELEAERVQLLDRSPNSMPKRTSTTGVRAGSTTIPPTPAPPASSARPRSRCPTTPAGC